jgi:phosphatidylserine decarboxylase
LVAWHPKASEENERTTVVLKINFGAILYRQIVGAFSQENSNYAEEGMQVVQGTDAGFIKFGSRVDLFYH